MFTPFQFQRASSALLLSSLVLALSACGGGGSDSPASPSNVKDPSPVVEKNPSPTDETNLLAPQGLSSDRFVATITTQQDFIAGTRQSTLLIVDTLSNTVAKQIKLSTSNSGDQVAITHNFIINPAAGEFSMKGQRAVYYIENGKVFRIDLHRESLPEPVQISNLQSACSIKEHRTYEIDGEILDIQTPGPDTDCSGNSVFGVVQITSSMSSWQSPPSIGLKAIDAIYAADGSISSIATLVYDMSNKLWAYTKDLQYRLYEIEPPADLLSMSKTIKVHLNVNLNTQLIEVGDALYTTRMVSGRLQFGDRVTSSTGQQYVRDVVGHLDKTWVLFNDGRLEQLVAADNSTTQYIATLPAGIDPIDDWVHQPSNLIMVTESPSTGNKSYYKVNPSTHTFDKLGTYVHKPEDRSVQLQGEDLLILRGNGPGTTIQSLLKYSLKDNVFETQLSNIIPAGIMASITKNVPTWEQFAFCEPVAPRSDCAGAPIRLRNLASNSEIELGSYTAAPSWLWSSAYMDEIFSGSSRVLMKTWNRTSTANMSTEIWTFDPKQSNSLLKITLPQ